MRGLNRTPVLNPGLGGNGVPLIMERNGVVVIWSVEKESSVLDLLCTGALKREKVGVVLCFWVHQAKGPRKHFRFFSVFLSFLCFFWCHTLPKAWEW